MKLLQLTANTGPEECCLAVRHALSRVLFECEQEGVHATLVKQVDSECPGNLRSVLLSLDGESADRLAQRWHGSLLWICRSPYRPRHTRKNWFIGGAVLETQAGDQWEGIDDRSVRFEALRASGPGGQHVNKTDSAVRATHLPSGLSVKVQTERSQHANRQLARALLTHKLAEQAQAAASEQRHHRWRQHQSVERGNAVRTFVGDGFIERLMSS